jgi:predicted ATP-binding protein involved in virulence
VRGGLGSETTRPDLGRLVKQALAYAAIASALAGDRTGHAGDVRTLGAAMAEAVDAAVQITGHRYRGVEPSTLEPLFMTPGGVPHLFDSLPTALKHVVAMIALPMRALWAAHRGVDPRRAEGVVLVDDTELHLPPRLTAALPTLLTQALPSAQWILATSSYELGSAVDASALVTLRHLPASDEVQPYVGALAITH